MFSIVYASQATREPGERDLLDLLDVARGRNETHDVTGMLLYAYGSFLQQLEGEQAALDPIWRSIERDERHTSIRLLSRRPVEERRFHGWWMGFEQPDDEALIDALPGFKSSMRYPLVNPDLVHNSTVAETLLYLYARNP